LLKIENNMQTTFRLNVNELDISFIEKLKKLFKNKEISIVVVDKKPQTSQYEMYKKSEALNKKYPPKIVSEHINISEIAKEVNL
jgi:hypothetical protein